MGWICSENLSLLRSEAVTALEIHTQSVGVWKVYGYAPSGWETLKTFRETDGYTLKDAQGLISYLVGYEWRSASEVIVMENYNPIQTRKEERPFKIE